MKLGLKFDSAKKLFIKLVKSKLRFNFTTVENTIKNEQIEKKKSSVNDYWIESYTKEEFDQFIENKKKEPIFFYEITMENLKTVKKYKKKGLYFNIPLSIGLTGLMESSLPIVASIEKYKILIFIFQYLFFVFGVLLVRGLRYIVITAEYLPDTHKVRFTKLNFRCKLYTIEENVDDLVRVPPNGMTPFLTLKNKKNNTGYSMSGVGIISDNKFFNYLFKAPKSMIEQNEKFKKMKSKKKEELELANTEKENATGNKKKDSSILNEWL